MHPHTVHTNDLYSEHRIILLWVHNWRDIEATHKSYSQQQKLLNSIPDLSTLAISLHKIDFCSFFKHKTPQLFISSTSNSHCPIKLITDITFVSNELQKPNCLQQGESLFTEISLNPECVLTLCTKNASFFLKKKKKSCPL